MIYMLHELQQIDFFLMKFPNVIPKALLKVFWEMFPIFNLFDGILDLE